MRLERCHPLPPCHPIIRPPAPCARVLIVPPRPACDAAALRYRSELAECRIDLNAARRQLDELRLQGVSVNYADFLEFQQMQACVDKRFDEARPDESASEPASRPAYAIPLMPAAESTPAVRDATAYQPEWHQYSRVTNLGTLIDVLG